jgi:hypothetical protein
MLAVDTPESSSVTRPGERPTDQQVGNSGESTKGDSRCSTKFGISFGLQDLKNEESKVFMDQKTQKGRWERRKSYYLG